MLFLILWYTIECCLLVDCLLHRLANERGCISHKLRTAFGIVFLSCREHRQSSFANQVIEVNTITTIVVGYRFYVVDVIAYQLIDFFLCHISFGSFNS